MLLKYFMSILQSFCGPVQIPHGECNLGLGHYASRLVDKLFRAECSRRLAQQNFGSLQVTELRHGNTSHCKCGGIITQSHTIERAKEIAISERKRRASY